MIYRFVKRLFDFVCALMGIIGTAPIWMVSIILTELSVPKTVFSPSSESRDTVKSIVCTAPLLGNDSSPSKPNYIGARIFCSCASFRSLL